MVTMQQWSPGVIDIHGHDNPFSVFMFSTWYDKHRIRAKSKRITKSNAQCAYILCRCNTRKALESNNGWTFYVGKEHDDQYAQGLDASWWCSSPLAALFPLWCGAFVTIAAPTDDWQTIVGNAVRTTGFFVHFFFFFADGEGRRSRFLRSYQIMINKIHNLMTLTEKRYENA